MKRKLMIGLLLAATGLAFTVQAADKDDNDAKRAELQKELDAAREQMSDAARKVGELSRQLGQDFNFEFRDRSGRVFSDRPMLGLVIDSRMDDKNKAPDGAYVVSVTPGGPADRAGIRADDVLLKIDDVSLAKNGAADLVTYLDGKKPGDKVTLSYRRGNDKREAEVMTEAMRHAFFSIDGQRVPPMPTMPPMPGMPKSPMVFDMVLKRWGDLELAPVSADLGDYFGVKKGLLVVRAPDDKDFKLQDGDIIQKIGGREPTDPGHALRILGSYQPGEKLTIDIVRHKKAMSLALTMPDTRIGAHWRSDDGREIELERKVKVEKAD